MIKTIAIYILTALLILFFWYSYGLQKENDYYKEVITNLGSEELIYYPELYSEQYIEQINVHNCMSAIDMCECPM